MIDALGRPQSVLLLGGTSEIALAVLAALPQERLRRVVLLGRDHDALDSVARSLPPDLGPEVEVLDAVDTDRHAKVIADVFARGDMDVTILAVGALGDQLAGEADPPLAVEVAQATFVGPLSLMLHTANQLKEQGHGRLIVLSSLAGVQARPANFIYGAAKGGLDLAARGTSDRLRGTGAALLLVRPGFVRTRMTSHLNAPAASSAPEQVAAAVVAALGGRRSIVYTPAPLRLVAAALVVLPRWVLRRLPF